MKKKMENKKKKELDFKFKDIAPVTVRNHKLSWRCKGTST